MARRKNKTLSLPDYIGLVGSAIISEKLGVSRQAVQSWARYDSAPRPQAAFDLITLSAGLLDWSSVYAPFVVEQKSRGA